MRKQRHMNELGSYLIRLRNENQSLIEKLNYVSDCHNRILQENARLSEEASDLRKMLTDLKTDSPFSIALRELEEVPFNTAQLRAESTNQSTLVL